MNLNEMANLHVKWQGEIIPRSICKAIGWIVAEPTIMEEKIPNEAEDNVVVMGEQITLKLNLPWTIDEFVIQANF